MSRYVISVIVAIAIGWLLAGMFWPWLGPMLVKPCPLFTPIGVIVVAVLFGLNGLWIGKRVP